MSSTWRASTPYHAGRRTGDAEALTTRLVYDRLGRAVLETSPRGIRIASEYDRLGRRVATVTNYRDGQAADMSADDDDLRATFAYNAVGELLATCTPEAVYGADACDPTSTASGSAAYQSGWHFAYDAMGRLVSEVRPVNASLTALDTHAWTYSNLGTLASECDHAAGGSCAGPDRHTDYVYDALGRETTKTVYAGSGTGSPRLGWTSSYAPDGSLTSLAFDGTGSSQGTDTLTFSYDSLGRADQVKRGSTVLTDFGWNPDGTLASRADGGLAASSFTYDWAQRLTSLTSPLFSGSLSYTWHNDGLLASRSWPSGAPGAATFSYDAAKRPTEMTKYGDAAGSFGQTYDRDGNVTSETRSLTGVSGEAGGTTQTFSYDGANRVISATGIAGGAGYVYDHDSNRVGVSLDGVATGYVYDRAGGLVSRVDDSTITSYAYDAYGNQTQAASAVNALTTSTYDAADRLTAITPPGAGATTFTFDALGRHASRSTPSGTDTYAYLGSSEQVWEIDDGSSLTRSSREPSGALAAIDAAGTDGFTLADLHGNLAAVVNAAETAYLSAVRYDSYGRTAASYDAGGAFPSPWGFQARLDVSPDAANPLYDFGARFYAPATGAFTQLDSYAGSPGDPLSLNRYLYAAANPWTLVDPTGHKFEMSAGTGTMSTTEYHHYVATQVAAAQATKRAAVQQRREAALATVAKMPAVRTPADVMTYAMSWGHAPAPTLGREFDLGQYLLGVGFLSAVVVTAVVAAPAVAAGGSALLATGSLSAACAAACGSLIPLAAEVGAGFAGAPTAGTSAAGVGGVADDLARTESRVSQAVGSGRASAVATQMDLPSSRTLSANLEAAGFARPEEAAAHHIVAGNAAAAAPARRVLSQYQIDINSVENGVFLPAQSRSLNVAGNAVHSTVHTTAYYELVNDLLLSAASRAEALDALNYLRAVLLSGDL